jgi:hypothetical protein
LPVKRGEMTTIFQSRRWTVLALSAIFLVAAVILWLAPEEQTLGSGIKSVYVHVALIWTGMVGLLLAGVLGLVTLVSGRHGPESWARSLAWLGLISFAAGLGMSVLAARVNWGAFFWQEPRTNVALQLLALALIVQVLSGWPLPVRLKGALRLLLILFMVWTTSNTPLVLHPGNAARNSGSLPIRLTFVSLFALTSLAAGWILLYLRLRKRVAEDRSQAGLTLPQAKRHSTGP